MKENIFGPRQWAFVVITGGAACALPFLQTDNAPTRSDSTSTSFPPEPGLDPHSALGSAGSAGGTLVAPSSLGDVVPSLPPPRLPEWASTDRSPFDDLVGLTAARPDAPAPQEQMAMQPLRPWIAGPNDLSAVPAAPSVSRTAAGAAVADGAIAQLGTNRLEASPWSDEPAGSSALGALAKAASHPPSSDLAARAPTAGDPATGALAAGALAASVDEAHRWPDQTVSAEELAQATRLRDRELASAIVPARPFPVNSSSSLLAAPALPVAAQRFGQAYVPPESATLRGPMLGGAAAAIVANDGSPDRAPAKDTNLAPLPATRKSHIIFQPGSRK